MLLPKSSLAALLLAGVTQAQYLINELSLGYNGKITAGGDRKVANFDLQGTPSPPEVLSNRLVLTPVAPGNQRSSVWGDNALTHDAWIADVDFRASGPERGGGNLNIWLAKRPQDIGSSSAYTVNRFEGLVIVVDTHGGTGGMVRGFLNDGSVDFASKPVLDSLVFGQCQYAYRNLGRPSQIKLRQGADNFRVEVDGKLCFESGNVQLPQGYKFGLTAATPDNPDSFEIFKLVVMADKSNDNSNSNSNNNNNNSNEQKQKPKPKQQQQKKNDKAKKDDEPSQFFQRDNAATDDPVYDDDIPDQDADEITSSASQFADLHDRLQVVNNHITTMQKAVTKNARTASSQHSELTKTLAGLRSDLAALGLLDGLNKKVESLEKEVKGLKSEVANKMRASEKNLKNVLTDHHATLADNIPGHSRLIVVIVASQVVLVGLYVVYKRRQNNTPKKYV